MVAGIDGLQKSLEKGERADLDLFDQGADSAAPHKRAGGLGPRAHSDPRGTIAQVPGSLSESLDALEVDHEFLTRGGVFSEELIRTWIDWKRENEVDMVALRPHPAEFALYYDA